MHRALAVTGVLKTKSTPDGKKSRPGTSIMRRGGVLQTPVRRRGTKEEGAHAVAGLVPGCPLCADDGYASSRGGATARVARVNGPKRCECRGQRYGEYNTA